jgi:beta-glucuronidase
MKSEHLGMNEKPISPTEVSLSKGWRFAPDPEDCGETLGWQAIDYDISCWEPVTVPHTWKIIKPTVSYEGIAWYRLVFDFPFQAEKACVRLKFDGVFYLSRVWLDGVYLGDHEGGYTPFEFDISSRIRSLSENVLAVRVDNRRSIDRLPAHLFEGRSYGWNNYGGIVRDVKLLLTSQVYINSLQVVASPHIIAIDQADRCSLSTRVDFKNISHEGFIGEAKLEVQEEAGRSIVATSIQPVNIPSEGVGCASFETSFQNPMLWHFDHPHLYCCVISLKDKTGIEYDRKTTNFGIREALCKDGQFILNGEPVRLVGLSRHADVPGYGLAEPIRVMAADFDDLKTLNMVFGRPVHYPQHEFIYDYCDRKGILLCPELPAWQLTACQMADAHMRALAKQQLAEMIAAASNHPCVWAWSVGNELESDTVAGRAFVRDMVEYVKSLDASRPVAFASYHLLVGRPWSDATQHSDFVMMNQYFGTWHGPKDSLGIALDTIHLTWPDKAVIVSEFGFAAHWQHVEGPQIIDPEQYYYIPEDVSTDSLEADSKRQQVIKEQMDVFRSKPFVVAAIFWNYRGGMGVVDDHGRPRPSWYVLQEEFAPLVIDRVDFNLTKQNQCSVNVMLRTRGPIEVDMPAYTLRNYRIKWEFISPKGKPLDLRGEVVLPVLSPGTKYNINIEALHLVRRSGLHITVIRPTGFTVIDRNFTSP